MELQNLGEPPPSTAREPEARGGEGPAQGHAGPVAEPAWTSAASGFIHICARRACPLPRGLAALQWAGSEGFPGPPLFVIHGADPGIELGPF